MDLVLVRHAEPVRIASGETGGAPADPGLTERGTEQARRLAAWLRHERVDTLISSPKQRAIDTMTPLAAALGMGYSVDEEIVEYDAAADHYIPMEELRATRDPRLEAMIEGRWDDFGGEPPHRFRDRLERALDRIIAEHPGERVVAVCHGGVINVMLAIVLGLDRHLWFDPGYTSISRIVASRSGPRSVVAVNETAHLYAQRKDR
jgi:probable phosphoglycerate mutase